MSRRVYDIVTVLLGLAVGLAVLELGVRVLFPDINRTSIAMRLQNEWPTWTKPSAEFHHIGDGIYELRFPTGPVPDGNRILIIGDSFAMGHGVGEEHRFGRILQGNLPGTSITVLATSSYSPIIYRNVLDKALSLSPYRAVVVLIDQTDPVDDLIYTEDLIGDGSPRFNVERIGEREGIVRAAYLDMIGRFSHAISFRSLSLLNFASPVSLRDYFRPGDKYYRYITRSLDRALLIGRFNEDPASPESEEMATLLLEHLGVIVSACQERQIPLFVAVVPWEFQSSQRPRVTLQLTGPFPKENRLETLLASRFGNLRGVTMIPLTRFFAADDDPSGLFLAEPPHEIHWNERGHILAEGVLRRYLTEALPDLR